MLFPLPGHAQLRRLINLRSLAITGQLLTLLAVWNVLRVELHWLPMLITVAALATLNFLSWVRLQSNRPVASVELFAQLLIDVLALTVLLYYGGGSTNPFVSLYLLPLVIAAATLPATYTWGMAALTTACYSWLMVYYIPLPHGEHEHNSDSAFNAHVLGMWLGFVISAVVVAYFVVKMAQAVRSRDELLARAREEVLRNERIVALGTQAAGAAHEMGTPLATMAVIIGELQADCPNPPSDLKENLSLLDEQVRACKRILDKIMVQARDSGTDLQQDVHALLAEVLDEWQLLRPTAHYRYSPQSSGVAPLLNVDVTLRAALMNVLNNAADASPENIEINMHWNQHQVVLQIHDNGTGLSEEAALQAGAAFFTTKPDGHGIGLMLSNATIERIGGSVRLFNREHGGATTEITLPIATGAKS